MEVDNTRKLPWLKRRLEDDRHTFGPARTVPGRRFDLLSLSWLRGLLGGNRFLFLARAIILAGLAFTILAGFLGSRVGGHNFAIIVVWIAWWTALKLIFIPFGGRSWCSVCPIPIAGEWSMPASIRLGGKPRMGFGLRWPRFLKGSWLQSASFLLIGVFSGVILTNPRLTAWVLIGLVALALGMSLVFGGRSFCHHLCPVGGFSGLYAQAAPLELRVVDGSVCKTHAQKTCYQSCPWGLYPPALQDNTRCSLCMECLRACPRDNIALNLRPPVSELGPARVSKSLDSSFLALTMSGSALAFSAVYLGPWGWLKTAVHAVGSPTWWVFAWGYLLLVALGLPTVFALTAWLGQNFSIEWARLRRYIARWSQVLVPLSLSAWAAFTIAFALPKLSYVVSVISDPFGWGWHLLGEANALVSIDLSGAGAGLAIASLVVGLYVSARIALRFSSPGNGNNTIRFQALPILAFCLIYAVGLLWLLVG